jgi:ribosomal protein S6
MIYELGYHLLPTVGDDNVANEVLAIKEILSEIKAEVVSDEYPVLITLEYDMVKRIDTKNTKFNQAYFGWIKFETTPDMIDVLKKKLEIKKSLLRYLIITTVRENTLISKNPLAGNIINRSGKHVEVKEELAGSFDEEAVDTEIEKLVEDVETSSEEQESEDKE